MKIEIPQSIIDTLKPGSTVIRITSDLLNSDDHYQIGTINRTTEGPDRTIGLYRIIPLFDSSGHNPTTGDYIIPYSSEAMELLDQMVSINKNLSEPITHDTLQKIQDILTALSSSFPASISSTPHTSTE